MGIAIDKTWCEARVNGELVPLTPTEWKLLLYLYERPGWHSVKEIAAMGFGDASLYFNSVRWHVRTLRAKLGREVILTRRFFGYAFNQGR